MQVLGIAAQPFVKLLNMSDVQWGQPCVCECSCVSEQSFNVKVTAAKLDLCRYQQLTQTYSSLGVVLAGAAGRQEPTPRPVARLLLATAPGPQAPYAESLWLPGQA